MGTKHKYFYTKYFILTLTNNKSHFQGYKKSKLIMYIALKAIIKKIDKKQTIFTDLCLYILLEY